MSAPAKPEAPPSGQGGTPLPTQAELESRKTQGTQPPKDQSTEAGKSIDATKQVPVEPTAEQRLIAAQEAALRDQHRQIAELTQRQRGLEERVTKAAEPAPPSTEDLNDQYWKNPVGVLSGLIQSELKKTVQPLNDQLARTAASTQMTELDRTKERLKTEYGDLWDKISPAIDEFVVNSTGKGQEVTPQLLEIAALTATGAYHRGKLTNNGVPVVPEPSKPNNPAPPENRNMGQDPPHLRPSAPNAPSQDQPQKKEARQLTENEARLARERGWTPEQYVAWLETPPEQVIHSKIGKEQPK